MQELVHPGDRLEDSGLAVRYLGFSAASASYHLSDPRYVIYTKGMHGDPPIWLYCYIREHISFHVTDELTRGIFCCSFGGCLCQ